MLKSLEATLFFYQGKARKTLKSGQQSLTVLGTAEQPLAELQLASQHAAHKILANDQQGSVVNVSSQPRIPSRSYTPYGYSTPEHLSQSALAYNGEWVDALGMYLLGSYRNYNPTIMRFLSPDSFSPFGDGGINAYAYCANNPILNTDPTGHIIPPKISQHKANALLVAVKKWPARNNYREKFCQKTCTHRASARANKRPRQVDLAGVGCHRYKQEHAIEKNRNRAASKKYSRTDKTRK